MLVEQLFKIFQSFSEELVELIGDFFENPTSRLPKEFVLDAKILRNEFKSYYETLSVSEDVSLNPDYLKWIADQIEHETPQLTVLKEIYDFRKMTVSSVS
jgi:hypothetical protein